MLNALKAKSSSKWYLYSEFSRHMTGDKSSFTSLENSDDGIVTFRDGNLAKVKDKGSIVILCCSRLEEVLYVEELKENLFNISQMYDKDYKVNFHQDLCEVVNKEENVVIIGHGTIDNCYTINPNSRTPLICSRAKLDEKDQAIILLASLPNLFATMVAKLLVGKMTWTMEEVSTSLLEYKNIRQSSS